MKVFLKNFLYFILYFIPIFYCISIFLMLSGIYKQYVSGNEIYLSIEKSKKKSKSKKLLLGDSVGKQLFSNSNDYDSINSLACNQAIGVVGQYLLLNNYINAGNKPEVVYILFSPFSFKNNLDQIYTFHYFLKPFYTKEYKDLLTDNTITQIRKIPYYFLSHEPYILSSNWAPDYTSKDSIEFTFLSPVSKEYLVKMKSLCDANKIRLQIIPAPTRKTNKKLVDDFDKNEFENLNCKPELEYFLGSVHYFEDSLFIDNAHLKKPELYTNEIISWFNEAGK